MARDEEAEFAALMERQAGFAYRVAYAVLANTADAEDAVQETFLKLHRHGGWQGAENERAYLARVAWRTAVDHRRAARSIFSLLEAPGDAIEESASAQPDPEQAILMANQEAMVHGLIDALPEDLRVPLVLSSAEELNSSEIARVLGIPEGTVRTRVQRARHVLRQKLDAMLVRGKEARNA